MRRDDATSAWRRRVGLLLISLATALQLDAAIAQVATPTPEQVDAFQSLSPEQQRAVLDAAASGSGASRTERAPESPILTQPRAESTETAVPVGPERLAFGSTLLLTVSIKVE